MPGSINVPLNKVSGVQQNIDPTSAAEFKAKCDALQVLPENKDAPIITHCGRGGRGNKAKLLLEELGYTRVLNGGCSRYILAVRARQRRCGCGSSRWR